MPIYVYVVLRSPLHIVYVDSGSIAAVPKVTNRREVLHSSCEPAQASGQAEQIGLGRLEVNVIFTDPQATTLALRTAAALAAELDACIRLRAVIVVPLQLPLDQPQISIPFTQKILSELVSHLDSHNVDVSAHLYLSRDRIGAFLELLQPNSVVVIAGRKRLWRTPESRLAKRLQHEGHRVVFIPWTKRDILTVSNGSEVSMSVHSTRPDSFTLGAR